MRANWYEIAANAQMFEFIFEKPRTHKYVIFFDLKFQRKFNCQTQKLLKIAANARI